MGSFSTVPPPSTWRTAQNSQRNLHLFGGDRGGRAWDAPEVAGREWGRLKHIIRHGAHFFLEWVWSRGHKKRQCEQSLSPALPPMAQLKGRTKPDRLFGREVEGTCLWALMVTFPAGTLPHPRPLPCRQKDGGPRAPRGAPPSHRRAFGHLRGSQQSMTEAG